MDYQIRPVVNDDKQGIVDIFNYYVENTMAAYPEQKVPPAFFDMLAQMAKGYPFYVAEAAGSVAGYALLRPHSPMPAFRRSAELTCFISPGYTGKGIGTALLDRLVQDARAQGIDTILASVSSANENSINFHLKHGFVRCGTFARAGKKFGKDFDEVWLQRFI
ncbi:N-acetyltransferase family protein [Methanocella sp. MCL-LM]|uniref:GNAT family N-acetyltransferase n=1 Tax=Methanocella sp. MCL-LM TaxID=3412035 RepID=UPI003C706511